MTTWNKTSGSRTVSPAFRLLPAQGSGLAPDPLANTRFCLGCARNMPTKGGFFVQAAFICSLHERRRAER